MTARWEQYGIAAAVSLMVHGAFGLSLPAIDESELLFANIIVPEIELLDFEVEPPPPPEPELAPEPEPGPEPEPPPEPERAPDPAPRPADPPPQRVETTPPPPTETAPPPPTTDEPAPGWASNDGPGVALDLGEVGPSATASVPVVAGKGRKPARMGAGSGKGGGGPAEATGTGGPAPVSVASIKKPAMPIGNKDLIQAKDYPEEAKRLGIEGVVKVKLIVDAAGKVTRRTLLQKLGHGFDELAMRYAGQLQFEPAIDTNDQPVTSVVVWTFRFVLPE